MPPGEAPGGTPSDNIQSRTNPMPSDRNLTDSDPRESKQPLWAQRKISALRSAVGDLNGKIVRLGYRADRAERDFESLMDLLRSSRNDPGSLGDFSRAVVERHAYDGSISVEPVPVEDLVDVAEEEGE